MSDKNALDQIIRIRALDQHHNFTLMCRDMSELSVYSKVDNTAFRQIKNNTPGPYTFILKATKEVPRRIQNAKRKTIGIRVPNNTIALQLLEELNAPILSTTLILPGEDVAESDPDAIQDKIGKLVGLVIHGGYLGEQATTVIDMSDGDTNIIRHGSGSAEPFE